MTESTVEGIAIATHKGQPMISLEAVEVVQGRGLVGDRYWRHAGSWQKDRPVGHRQVTLINARFVERSSFPFLETRRNVLVSGTELMWLIGREFDIGDARMRGVKYCDPCERPTALADIDASFSEEFEDCGGIVAEIIRTGVIRVGSLLVPPKKNYE